MHQLARPNIHSESMDIHISYEYIYDFKVNGWIQWMTIVFNSSVLQRTLLSILDDLHMKRAEPCWQATCDESKWYDDRNTKLFIFFVLSVHSRAKWLLFWFLLSSSAEFLCQVSDNIVKNCWLDDAPSFQVSMKKSGVQVCFTYSMPSWIFLDSTFLLGNVLVLFKFPIFINLYSIRSVIILEKQFVSINVRMKAISLHHGRSSE